MTPTTTERRRQNPYRLLQQVPGVPVIVLFSTMARLAGAMVGLALVLAVSEHLSLAHAGVATAACIVGMAVAGPLRGRLVDRAGATPALLVMGLGQPLTLLGLFLALRVDQGWGWPVVLAMAFAAGALTPPVASVMRSVWARLTGEHGEVVRHAAHSWESVATDVVYVVAPSLVAVVAVTATPGLALTAAALLTAGGCLAMTRCTLIRRLGPAPTAARTDGGVPVAAISPLLVVSLLTGGAITASELAAVHAGQQAGHAASAGWLIAALSLGSIAGGLLYGARRPPGSDLQHLAACLALWACGHLLCAVSQSLPLTALALALSGLGLAPGLTVQFKIVGRVVPEHAQTEGFAWLATAGQAGSAAAAVVTGFLAAPWPFLFSAGLVAAAALTLPRVRRSEGPINSSLKTT